MAQVYLTRFNKAMTTAMVANAGTPDSLSYRLEGIEQSAEVFIESISWGVFNASEVGLDSFDFGMLHIIRNESFDEAYNYGVAATIREKDCVFTDMIVRTDKFRFLPFPGRGLRLTGASKYLIVMGAPRDNSGLGTVYDGALSVNGRIRNRRKTSPDGDNRIVVPSMAAPDNL